MAQVDDAQFAAPLGDEENSIALIVKHMAGNLRSRWTDFLATDGEKPDRDRDSEFELGGGDARAALMEAWERGWATFLGTLESLTPDDLARTVHIRGEPHTVIRAVDRGVAHACYHVGQIVLLAKHFAGPGVAHPQHPAPAVAAVQRGDGGQARAVNERVKRGPCGADGSSVYCRSAGKA